jgi:hypothetical protein
VNRQQALAALDRLEALIKLFGAPNPEQHCEFNQLVRFLRSGTLAGDDYFVDKLVDLEEQANVGFSIRKFENRPGGLTQVRVWALGSLSIARGIVEDRLPS